MILDKPFQNRGSDSQRRGEGTISFHARSADVRRLTGCYAIPFTLQHQVDGFQPNEVRIHASILRRELAPQTDAEELASDEQVFRFSDWPSPSP
jgi:hypothetical protein